MQYPVSDACFRAPLSFNTNHLALDRLGECGLDSWRDNNSNLGTNSCKSGLYNALFPCETFGKHDLPKAP